MTVDMAYALFSEDTKFGSLAQKEWQFASFFAYSHCALNSPENGIHVSLCSLERFKILRS